MFKVISGVVSSIVVVIFLIVSSNPTVSAGAEGYVYENPRIFGEGGYQGSIIGPSNFGISLLRNEIIAIDMRPQKYINRLSILAKDGLNTSVTATAIIKLKTGSIKDIVENYSGIQCYTNNVDPVFDSVLRNAVKDYEFEQMKVNRVKIARTVEKELNEYFVNKPFVLVSLTLNDITPPKKVLDAIETKLAMDQKEQAKEAELRIAKKDAEIEVAKANGIADAQEIIDKTLTKEYLQFKAIEAQEKMASSPNHTTIYIPSGNNGIPIINTIK